MFIQQVKTDQYLLGVNNENNLVWFTGLSAGKFLSPHLLNGWGMAQL